jgi:hypothetical protein
MFTRTGKLASSKSQSVSCDNHRNQTAGSFVVYDRPQFLENKLESKSHFRYSKEFCGNNLDGNNRYSGKNRARCSGCGDLLDWGNIRHPLERNAVVS